MVASEEVKTVTEHHAIYRGYADAFARLQAGGSKLPPKALVAAVNCAAIPVIMALVSSAILLAKWWWDCAAPISLVCDLSQLTDVVLLDKPSP